jgi:four helix bundle protein
VKGAKPEEVLYFGGKFVLFTIHFSLFTIHNKLIRSYFMKESILQDKALKFASNIVLFYQDFSKCNKENTIPKQLLRSGTSIGANINEAAYGNSKADFISKMHISLKETGESIYWLRLLENTNFIEKSLSDKLIKDAEEIKRILISSINTAKE